MKSMKKTVISKLVWLALMALLISCTASPAAELSVRAAEKSGWVVSDGKTYYYRDGKKLTGFQTISGYKYYFADNRYPNEKAGVRLTGYKKISGNWFYFADGRYPSAPRGSTLSGIHTIEGRTYFFRSNGSIDFSWKQKVIVLDPGHSSQIPSGTVAIGPGSSTKKAADSIGTRGVATKKYEYDLNLTIAKALKKELERRGYKVLMTRTKNSGTYSCIDRANVANKNKADLMLRIHANASPNNTNRVGAMAICITPKNKFVPGMYAKSKLLSCKILGYYAKATGCHKEYVWETDTMTGNNWSKVPTTLIEMGYMSNAKEDRLMQTASYQKKMVKGLADGIDAYFKALK